MPTLTDEIKRLSDEIKALRTTRELFVGGIRQIVREMLKEFREARIKMARKTKADIAASRENRLAMAQKSKADLSNFISGLETRVCETLAGFRRRRLDTAKKISELRQKTAAMLKEFAEDIAGAHRAWATLSQKAVRGKSERHEVGRVSRDDLTEIPGIGAKMAKRLREVGVETFTQLARQSPENLRHELGKINRAAKVEKWITCARELAKTAK